MPDNAAGQTVSASYSFSLNQWYHVAVSRVSGVLYLFVNGVLQNAGGTSFTTNVKDSSAEVRVGRLGFDATYKYQFFGRIDEVRITKGSGRGYTSTFTAPTEAYPNSAPYTLGNVTLSIVAPTITISSQPSNQTASSGSATFSVTASVTLGGSLTYQWQKSDDSGSTWADVSGATSSSLSLSSLTNGSDDADQYRVVVSSSGATSVTSSAATLTVAAAAAITYANKYGSFAHSVTGTSTVTATLAGTGYASTDTRLWLLVGTTGTLSYTVTASSQAGFDIGRLFVSSSSPASNAALTAVSGEVSGTQTSSGTLSVTAGQHLVLVYTKDSEDSELNDRITATLSIA
jgi:hypothetical protein